MEERVEERVEEKNLTKYYIFLVVAIFLSMLSFFLIMRPIYKDIKNKASIIDVKSWNLNVLKKKDEKLKELSSRSDEIKKSAEKVKAALPEGKDKARLFIEFEGLASSSGLTLISANEQTSTVDSSSTSGDKQGSVSGVSEVEYKLELKGSPEGFLIFLINSQKALRILRLDKIEVSEKEGDSNLDINITLSAFYKVPENSESKEEGK